MGYGLVGKRVGGMPSTVLYERWMGGRARVLAIEMAGGRICERTGGRPDWQAGKRAGGDLADKLECARANAPARWLTGERACGLVDAERRAVVRSGWE